MESIAGHEEKLPFPQGSPEHAEWVRERLEAKAARQRVLMDLTLDYGIQAWLPPPPLGLPGAIVRLFRAVGLVRWRTDPPRGWDLPESLKRYNVSQGLSKRVTYIRLELLVTQDDILKVLDIASEAGELEEEEVDTALQPFRDAAGNGRSSPPADDAASEGRGDAARGARDRETMGAQ